VAKAVPPKPVEPDFRRDLFNLQPGTAAQILPPLIKKYAGTPHEAGFVAALRAHRTASWLMKRLDKRWAAGLRELLAADGKKL